MGRSVGRSVFRFVGRSVVRSGSGFVVVLGCRCGEVLIEVDEIGDCPTSKNNINQNTKDIEVFSNGWQ